MKKQKQPVVNALTAHAFICCPEPCCSLQSTGNGLLAFANDYHNSQFSGGQNVYAFCFSYKRNLIHRSLLGKALHFSG